MKRDTTRDPAPEPTDKSAGLPQPERGGAGGYATTDELRRLEQIGPKPGQPGGRGDRGVIPGDEYDDAEK